MRPSMMRAIQLENLLLALEILFLVMTRDARIGDRLANNSIVTHEVRAKARERISTPTAFRPFRDESA